MRFEGEGESRPKRPPWSLPHIEVVCAHACACAESILLSLTKSPSLPGDVTSKSAFEVNNRIGHKILGGSRQGRTGGLVTTVSLTFFT